MRKLKIEQKNIKSGFLDKKTPLFTRVWFKGLPEILKFKYMKSKSIECPNISNTRYKLAYNRAEKLYDKIY